MRKTTGDDKEISSIKTPTIDALILELGYVSPAEKKFIRLVKRAESDCPVVVYRLLKNLKKDLRTIQVAFGSQDSWLLPGDTLLKVIKIKDYLELIYKHCSLNLLK